MKFVQIGVSTANDACFGKGSVKLIKMPACQARPFSKRLCPTTFEPDAAT